MRKRFEHCTSTEGSVFIPNSTSMKLIYLAFHIFWIRCWLAAKLSLNEWLSTDTDSPERLWNLPPWKKPYGHGLVKPALVGPSRAERLDLMTSRGPFPSQPFYNSVKSRCINRITNTFLIISTLHCNTSENFLQLDTQCNFMSFKNPKLTKKFYALYLTH